MNRERIVVSRPAVILSGKKSISSFVGRSWTTVAMWIAERGFPARKLDGVWEADAEMIIEWRRDQLKGG